MRWDDVARDAPLGDRVVRELDPVLWSAFVKGHPNASVFHTPEMHRVMEETKGYTPGLWATLDAGDEILALFNPASISILGPPLRRLTTRWVSFAEPLVAPGPSGARGLETLLRAYTRDAPRHALFTEIRNVSDRGDLAPSVEAAGFRREGHLNFLVDLTASHDDLWKQVSPPCRRNINKARRVGVELSVATGPDDIAAGYEVLRDVYRRVRVPLADRSLFEAAHRILAPAGMLEARVARHEGRVIGVMNVLTYQDVSICWYGGLLRAHSWTRTADLLTWDAVERAKARGSRILDLGGAGRPEEPYGVRDFKAKFGGELVDFGRDVWVPSRVRLRMATTGYEILRRFL